MMDIERRDRARGTSCTITGRGRPKGRPWLSTGTFDRAPSPVSTALGTQGDARGIAASRVFACQDESFAASDESTTQEERERAVNSHLRCRRRDDARRSAAGLPTLAAFRQENTGIDKCRHVSHAIGYRIENFSSLENFSI